MLQQQPQRTSPRPLRTVGGQTSRRSLTVTEAEGLPCRDNNPDLWFAEYPAQVELAKSLCAGCPVRDACLAGALERAESAGVWGGELIVNGAIVAFKRGRGRPRKTAPAPAAA